MKTLTIQKYACGICGHAYDSKESALKCESRPVTHDDVQIGDEVEIATGEGQGQRLKVEEKWIVSMEWGHYAWERYWHTVSCSGPVLGSWGHRQLTFDARKKVNESNTKAEPRPSKNHELHD
jgi:hypothetical protein